jgi:hypothetical protein
MQDAETSASAKAVLLFSLVGIAVSALFLLSSAGETIALVTAALALT